MFQFFDLFLHDAFVFVMTMIVLFVAAGMTYFAIVAK